MSKRNNIAIIGGDKRQNYTAIQLMANGYNVFIYGMKNISALENSNLTYTNDLRFIMSNCNVIICPIPFSQNQKDISFINMTKELSIDKFLVELSSKHILFGGLLPEKVLNYCKEKKIEYYDFLQRDSFSILNAIATAEGTIAEAIKRSNRNLHNSNCLITGFGKCAQILSKKLKAIDVNVSIAARNINARALAQAYGYKSISIDAIDNSLYEYDFIINTVPSIIFTEEKLKMLKKDVLLIDIASLPGGVDFMCAERMSINAVSCLGLPGKYAPQASGEIIAEIIENILMERSEKYEAGKD